MNSCFYIKYFYRISVLCIKTLILAFCILLGIACLLLSVSRPVSRDAPISDEIFQLLKRSAISKAQIGIPKTSRSLLKPGLLEFFKNSDSSMQRNIFPHKSCISESDVRRILEALGSITIIEESPVLVPSEIDCVLELSMAEHCTIFIKASEPQLIIKLDDYIYRGGNSRRFITVIGDIWKRHPNAEQVQVEIFSTDERQPWILFFKSDI